MELLGIRPPKRSPSPEPENFLLPPLSLVCMGLHGVGFSGPQNLAGLNLLFLETEKQGGQGLAEGQMDGQSSSQGEDPDLLAQAIAMKGLCK